MGRHSLPSLTARRISAARKTYGAGAGRPRTDAPRCPCEIMTLARAQARGKSSEHDPSCPFYRERATII
ncbi:hypothetical protein SBA4_20036 [Candidatus Sulfopaludibacter sp. SbA4]|nr:hypothetical protein SBA4_20036 [Candidatus Sulfopaludibacter sp. SbA4]